ncbi:unnamed protein product [Adineta steineri]|uniref:Uncharacterized protein n=1 Tax=Adineta steineri TaxID=433720 RepID=A0A815NUS6_9BILA|nr:unnamed protein product [Adineta steineri]CAF3647279.1 unnamed protein product [Adineta steineri]
MATATKKKSYKPSIKEQKQINSTILMNGTETEKETPSGFISFYPGVSVSEDKFTCPVLSIHLYYQTQLNGDGRNQYETDEEQQNLTREQKSSGEEEVIMLLLEDVTRISYKAAFTKGIDTDIKSSVESVYSLGENDCNRCLGRKRTEASYRVKKTPASVNRDTNYREEDLPVPKTTTGCFNLFRCWCCRKKKLVRRFKKIYTKTTQQAERVITITIEYSKYSSFNSASKAHVLRMEQQVAYYKEKFQPDTELKFYLINNKEIDSKNFDMRRHEAETLCRTVMQLKGMKDHYPSENGLKKILDQSDRRTFGEIFQEPTLEITTDGRQPHPPSHQPAAKRKIKRSEV